MKISILAAQTLQRFTSGILESGFQKCGIEVVPLSQDTSHVLAQIHGSPGARESDREIMKVIPDLARKSIPCVVLLHRPDEIRDTLPELREILINSRKKLGLVMLGNMLIDDPFYGIEGLRKKVIPHGFFDLPQPKPSPHVLIGSHTTWGEMRSIDQALELIAGVFDMLQKEKVSGYLGGAPHEFLEIEYLTKIATKLDTQLHFEVFRKELGVKQLKTLSPRTILLNPGPVIPKEFDLTFNIQMYHYNDAIRLGESSGSLHSGYGIPVILEMNGSEVLEGLEVVRVPYGDMENKESCDFTLAAEHIAELVRSGHYKKMLRENEKRILEWNNGKVAQMYRDFFLEL